MRLRNIHGARDVIADSSWVIQNAEDKQDKWKEVFENSNPVRIEIGMGKGRFLYQLAGQNPDINYVGIEKYSSVLLRALQKMEEAPLSNLRFIRMDAEGICNVFGEGEIDRIYLNFSDPWPKDRHAKRRLPSAEYLERYDRILKKDGRIEFKTDNKELFEFALEQLPDSKWETKELTFDLHHNEDMMKGNVMTEYEEKFSAKGNPIYKYVICRKNK